MDPGYRKDKVYHNFNEMYENMKSENKWKRNFSNKYYIFILKKK